MRRLSKDHKTLAKKDRDEDLATRKSAQGEAIADRARGKSEAADPCQPGCAKKTLAVALASVDKTVKDRRKMSHLSLQRSAVICSSPPIRSGNKVASKYRKLWLTSSKMVVIPAFRNGCAMHKRQKQHRGQACNSEAPPKRPTKP